MDVRELEEKAKVSQRNLIEEISAQKEPQFKTYEGLRIICLPKVFYPQRDTVLLAKTAEVSDEETVLESCSGSGFISVFLAKKAKRVYATDINESAVENIKENVKLHNLGDKVSVFHCDLFPDKDIRYDIIVANLPYTDNKAANDVEKCVWDESHATTIRFFREVKNYLKENGRIYLSWGNFADFTFLENLAKESGFTIENVASTQEDDREVSYNIYLLKPTPTTGLSGND